MFVRAFVIARLHVYIQGAKDIKGDDVESLSIVPDLPLTTAMVFVF